jgi:hypothetical protein
VPSALPEITSPVGSIWAPAFAGEIGLPDPEGRKDRPTSPRRIPQDDPLSTICGDWRGSIPGVDDLEPREINRLSILSAPESSALKTPAHCFHLVARKGRMASDRLRRRGVIER